MVIQILPTGGQPGQQAKRATSRHICPILFGRLLYFVKQVVEELQLQAYCQLTAHLSIAVCKFNLRNKLATFRLTKDNFFPSPPVHIVSPYPSKRLAISTFIVKPTFGSHFLDTCLWRGRFWFRIVERRWIWAQAANCDHSKLQSFPWKGRRHYLVMSDSDTTSSFETSSQFVADKWTVPDLAAAAAAAEAAEPATSVNHRGVPVWSFVHSRGWRKSSKQIVFPKQILWDYFPTFGRLESCKEFGKVSPRAPALLIDSARTPVDPIIREIFWLLWLELQNFAQCKHSALYNHLWYLTFK